MWETPRERPAYTQQQPKRVRPPKPVRYALLQVESVWDRLVDRLNRLGLSEDAILLGFAVAIGAASALGVVAFYKAIDAAYLFLYRWPGARLPEYGIAVVRPILTAFGLWLAWWIVRRAAHGYDGANVPDVQRAVARRGGDVPTRPALARTAASAVTLGTGGSAGSEGPVAVLGAAVGSLLGRLFRFHPQRVKVLVGAGAAAGISAAFNAPLAGAFFALEEILGSFAVGSFPPVVVASVIGAVVSHIFLGRHPAFPVPTEYGYTLAREVLVFYPLLGILSGIVAAMFVRTYFGVDERTRALRLRWNLPDWSIPVAGGLVVGLMVYASRGLLVGHGHFAVHLELFGRMPWTQLALLALGSMLATSITLGTGGSGGLFTPSLYVGAAAGGAFGVALRDLFPALGLHPEAYALVGMGAVVAAATGAPITGILLVFEMTNDYAIVLPLMLTVVIAHVVARRIEPDSLYSGWLRRRGEHIRHGSDPDLLAGMRVRDVLDRETETVDARATANALLRRLAASDALVFPVVDGGRRLVGMVTVFDLGRAAVEKADQLSTLTAGDLAAPVEAVAPDDSLLEAIRRMGLRGAPSLPVVDPKSGKLLGLVTRAHILARYERTVAEMMGHETGTTGQHPVATGVPAGARGGESGR